MAAACRAHLNLSRRSTQWSLAVLRALFVAEGRKGRVHLEEDPEQSLQPYYHLQHMALEKPRTDIGQL